MKVKKTASLTEKKDVLEKMLKKINMLQEEAESLRHDILMDENKIKAEKFNKYNLSCEQLGVDFEKCGEMLLQAIKTQDYSALEKYIEEVHLEKIKEEKENI